MKEPVDSSTPHPQEPTATFADLIAEILAFRDARDWQPFHNAKDLALGLNVEAAELLECWLWKRADQADPQNVREELADVLIYALLLANTCGLDPAQIIREKLDRNAEKYPVEKAKGSAKKYTEL